MMKKLVEIYRCCDCDHHSELTWWCELAERKTIPPGEDEKMIPDWCPLPDSVNYKITMPEKNEGDHRDE